MQECKHAQNVFPSKTKLTSEPFVALRFQNIIYSRGTPCIQRAHFANTFYPNFFQKVAVIMSLTGSEIKKCSQQTNLFSHTENCVIDEWSGTWLEKWCHLRRNNLIIYPVFISSTSATGINKSFQNSPHYLDINVIQPIPFTVSLFKVTVNFVKYSVLSSAQSRKSLTSFLADTPQVSK